MNRQSLRPTSIIYVFITFLFVSVCQSWVCDAQFGINKDRAATAAAAAGIEGGGGGTVHSHPADSDDVADSQGKEEPDHQPDRNLLDFDMSKYQEVATKLQITSPDLDGQDAIDLAVLLDAAVQDPETKMMVENLRSSGSKRLEAFEDSTTQAEMVMGLKQTLDELKALEYLFQDPVRAVTEMTKEGIVDPKRIDFYGENPEELANDTRKGLYFSFVSLAVAAGLLEFRIPDASAAAA
eukprot:CAMPEP_0113482742 /NCGR_PEP_ID=MMETSP0014_2-20120614/23078_1 /TAXON_ID=2857 /ORGANISM="Nitzschia sp." /LENGTH=237 /DNA_ID=CAMNT_0000376273 /DNA_START=32 /DNA_END=743 /DNA_ORIENTATION=- /assembly_acc=CAM_ASM_000159